MKLLICLAVAGLVTLQCTGQTVNPATNTKTDSTQENKADSTKPKSTLTLGAVYCMNADYYGQTALEKLPYVAAAATYHLKSGIYFTGLAYKLLSDTGKRIISAANFGAGIDFKISKKLSADISYTHTLYPGVSPFLQAGNPDNGSIALSYDAWIKPSISADYAFGNTSDIFTTAGISKAVTLGRISKKDVVTITPVLSVVGGTQHFYQTYIAQKKLADSLLGILFTPVTGAQAPGSSSFTKTVTTFNILSYNFKMPLDYNRANYLVEASCQFSMLSNNTEAGPGKVNSFFSFSFYYQF
jgi:hypothetical protein